jgi:NhaA family Na+:H+ antiporter
LHDTRTRAAVGDTVLSVIEDRRPPIDRLLAPFREFARTTASGGLVLMAATIVALLWANSPWADSYTTLWATELSVSAGGLTLSDSLLHLINDGLMAIYFLLVGLELKRGVLVGELATARKATLPIVAAAGGAIVPAVIFLAFVGGGEAARGWAVPMATDIAFALGGLALLGSRASLGLRIFLTALPAAALRRAGSQQEERLMAR